MRASPTRAIGAAKNTSRGSAVPRQCRGEQDRGRGAGADRRVRQAGGGPAAGERLVPVGPVPRASASGARCARTTAPTATAWDYFPHDHARSRAYRWSEDGLAGLLRRRAAALPRPRAVERPRPDPQGADVRADRRRGQPRRGRQGVLVVPRRDCPATPGSAGATTTRRPRSRTTTWSRRTAGAGRRDPEYELLDTGVFDDDRYWVVDVDYAKAAPTDLLHDGPRDQRRARTPTRCTCCRTLWFRNTWSWDGDGAGHELGRRRTHRSRTEHPFLGDARAAGDAGRTARADAAVLRQRDQRRAALRGARPDAVPEGRHQRPRRAGAATVNPDAARHEGARLVPARRCRPAADGRAAAAPAPDRRAGAGRARRRLRPRSWPAAAGGRRVLRRADARRRVRRRGRS